MCALRKAESNVMFEAIIDSKEFVTRLQAGDDKAFDLLGKEGSENVVPLLRSLRLYEPEDAWHDCWLELKRTKCSGYDPARGKLSNWVLVRATTRARKRQRER